MSTVDEIARLRECLVQVQNASIDLTQQIARLRDENDRLRDEVAICRDAVESAVDLVTDWANDPENDSDGSQGAARAIRRKLNEAIGKACPALMFEKPDGQRLYGLRWRELKDELARARAELERVTAERDELRALWHAVSCAEFAREEWDGDVDDYGRTVGVCVGYVVKSIGSGSKYRAPHLRDALIDFWRTEIQNRDEDGYPSEFDPFDAASRERPAATDSNEEPR